MIFTAPLAPETVRLVAFSEPAVLKSMPPVPADKLVVVEVSAPVALMPPAPLDADNANVLPELAPS